MEPVFPQLDIEQTRVQQTRPELHYALHRYLKHEVTHLIFKVIIVSLLVVVLFSLASAAIAMVQGDTSGKMLRALTWRIGLSVFIFILLLIGQATGLITPHGL